MDFIFQKPIERTPNYILKQEILGKSNIASQFGFSICNSLNGNIIVVGEPVDNSGGTQAGSASVFTGNREAGWSFKQKLTGVSPSSQYGISVANSKNGSVIILGGNLADFFGLNNAGAAIVFTGNINDGWKYKALLTGDSPEDRYGTSVATNENGNIIAVGGTFDDEGATNAGAVLIYTGNANSTWRIKQKITGDTAGDFYGDSVSINDNGTIILVGGRLDDDNGINAGAALVYTGNINQGWNFKQKILGDYASNFLGVSTAISYDGSTLILGQNGDDINGLDAGAVSVYTGNSQNGWEISQKLFGEAPGDRFGESVALDTSGKFLTIGSPYYDKDFIPNVGAGYIYTKNNNGTFELKEKVVPNFSSSTDSNAFYGRAVSVLDNNEISILGGTNVRNEFGNAVGGIRIYESNQLKDYIFTNTNDQIEQFETKYSLIQKFGDEFKNGTWPQLMHCDSSGLHLIIGCSNDFGSEGTAIIYTGEKIYQAKDYLTDFEYEDYFGNDVKISKDGSTVMVAAYGDDNFAGEVSLYTGDRNRTIGFGEYNYWIEKQRLEGLPPRIGAEGGFAAGEQFGCSIDMNYNASVLFVGSRWDGNYRGTINIFTGNKYNGWNIQTVLTGILLRQPPWGQNAIDGFGTSIFCNYSGNLIGGLYYDAGKINIYNQTNNTWNLIKSIENPLSGMQTFWENNFGKFADNGNILLYNIYASDNNPGIGRINIYTGLNTWNLKQTIYYTGSSAQAVINLDGSIVAIGYPEFSLSQSPTMGKVDIYTGNSINGWELFQSLSGDYPNYAIGIETSGDGFGSSLAINDIGDKIFIGAPNDGITNSGSCFVYELQTLTKNNQNEIKFVNFGI